MKGHKSFKLAIALLVSMALVLPNTVSVFAQTPPPNDSFYSVTVVSALPFSDTVSIDAAGTEPNEPQPCNSSPQTVWYSFTPSTNMMIRANLVGSSIYEKGLTVYQLFEPGFGGLSYIICTSFDNNITLDVQAGTTYYFQASSLWWYQNGTLQIHIEQVSPPPNDNWANAKVITGLPFDDGLDASAATREAGEPTPSCAMGDNPGRTTWYAFTSQETRSISANTNTPSFPVLAVYTGSSLTGLTEIGCHTWSMLTFRATAGTTYYFQVANQYAQVGWLGLHVDFAPPPQASIGFSPSDPTVFDAVQFYDSSWDPAGVGIQSQAWNLGDGTTATGQNVSHRYATDGDYTVKLTVTTPDERTASTSQVVHVKTHDVAITKLSAPQSASVGQTRQIAVEINSKRYVEYVEIQLLKSVPGGYEWVGTLRQQVPVRPSNRTTTFAFSYTFTKDDATMGKVTFKAVATIMNARDALPADNEAIASPTKVNRSNTFQSPLKP